MECKGGSGGGMATKETKVIQLRTRGRVFADLAETAIREPTANNRLTMGKNWLGCVTIAIDPESLEFEVDRTGTIEVTFDGSAMEASRTLTRFLIEVAKGRVRLDEIEGVVVVPIDSNESQVVIRASAGHLRRILSRIAPATR